MKVDDCGRMKKIGNLYVVSRCKGEDLSGRSSGSLVDTRNKIITGLVLRIRECSSSESGH